MLFRSANPHGSVDELKLAPTYSSDPDNDGGVRLNFLGNRDGDSKSNLVATAADEYGGCSKAYPETASQPFLRLLVRTIQLLIPCEITHPLGAYPTRQGQQVSQQKEKFNF